LWNLILVC